MKYLFFSLLSLTLMLVTLVAHAGEIDCIQLHDSDARRLCTAQATHNANECSAIMVDDKRRLCRALVTGSSNECAAINNTELRANCRGLTR